MSLTSTLDVSASLTGAAMIASILAQTETQRPSSPTQGLVGVAAVAAIAWLVSRLWIQG